METPENINQEYLVGKESAERKELASRIDETSPQQLTSNLTNVELPKPAESNENLYSPEEYQNIKSRLVDYIKGSFGKGGFDAQDFNANSLDKTSPFIVESLVRDLVTSSVEGVNSNIDINKFMETHKNHAPANEVFETDARTAGFEKQHDIGKILEQSTNNQVAMNALISRMLSQGKFKLSIQGSADATEVSSKQKIQNLYTTLRGKLFEGCNDSVKANLENIFPEFNDQNFKDKKDYNRAYALSRIMSEICFLYPQNKNSLLSGEYKVLDKKENESGKREDTIKLGNSVFKITVSDEKGKEHTFGKLSATTTEGLSKYYEYMLNQLDNVKISFLWGSPNARENNSGGYIGTNFNNGVLASDRTANPGQTRSINKSVNKPIDVSEGNGGAKSLRIDLSRFDRDMVLSKYPDYFKINERTGTLDYNRVPTFVESLQIMKGLANEINDGNSAKYADQLSGLLNNYKKLTEIIASDPKDFIDHIISIRHPNTENYQSTYNSYLQKIKNQDFSALGL